jgi:hypothetical protein
MPENDPSPSPYVGMMLQRRLGLPMTLDKIR